MEVTTNSVLVKEWRHGVMILKHMKLKDLEIMKRLVSGFGIEMLKQN